MKRLYPIFAAAMLAACSSSSSSSSGGSTTGGSSGSTSGASTTTGATSTTTGGSSTSTGGSTGVTTSSSTTTGSSTTTTGSSGSTGGSSGSSGSTGGPPPANDACSNAIALTPHAPGDTQTVTGDTTNATDDFESTGCGGYGGDVFYTLHLTATSEVTVALTPTDSTKTGVASILPNCSATTELTCGTSSSTGTATVTAPHLAPGDYIVVADNFSGDEGAFSLTVTLGQPLAAPSNDTCAAPKPLPEGDAGLTGETFLGAGNDYNPGSTASCAGFDQLGPDLVYSFTPSQSGAYKFSMTETSATSHYVSLYLVDSCPASDGGAISSCLGGKDSYGHPAFTANLSGGTTYFLIADSEDNSASNDTFDLLAQYYVTPVGESCAVLPADGGGDLALSNPGDGGLFGQVSYDTTGYANDTTSAVAGSCGGDGYGGDRVFHVHLANAAPSLTATITPNAGSGVKPVVSIRSAPCTDTAFADGGAGSELACQEMSDGGVATAVVTSPAAGDYYIWADEFSGTEGAATLTVTAP